VPRAPGMEGIQGDSKVTGTRDGEIALDQLRDLSGALERPIGARPLAVPREVVIEGERLRWWTPVLGMPSSPEAVSREELDRCLGKPLEAMPGDKMLESFVRLHRKSDQDIRNYAAKWGPLGICRHGLPHTHWPLNTWDIRIRRATDEERQALGGRHAAGMLPCWQLVEIAARQQDLSVLREPVASQTGPTFVYEAMREFCQPLGTVEERNRGGWDPLERWRRFSSEAALILRTAAELHSSDGWTTVSSRDADILLHGVLSEDEAANDDRTSVHWEWVRSSVERWLTFGNVRPYLHRFENGRMSVGYGTADSPTGADMYVSSHGYFLENVCGLFGALATQILLVVSREGGLANCAFCGLPFFPERQPALGKSSWCLAPECRRAMNTQAKRDSRKKRRNTDVEPATLKGNRGRPASKA